MHEPTPFRAGIGFATGRKSFRKVLRTNVYNWQESGLVADRNVSLNLFVAYDLDYNKTRTQDYTQLHRDLTDQIDRRWFIGSRNIEEETASLAQDGVLTPAEARMLFGKGYAGKRNAVLYMAIKNKMDCLVFLDDDEYPLAVTRSSNGALWSGQEVLAEHLRHIGEVDITHGHHCGYVSPIPQIRFDDTLTASDFRLFIEAISNDILQWEKIESIMQDGGVTYADKHILTRHTPEVVEESLGLKFISGANLCINLTDPTRVFPFYNPPGARGEDTFLATCLHDRSVLRIPTYSFHDGFSTYQCLLDGVLPIRLKQIRADHPDVANRFFKACIGWIRYKPLLLKITRPAEFDALTASIREKLTTSLPALCDYFREPRFMEVLSEFEKYTRRSDLHLAEFAKTRVAWAKLMDHLTASRG
ncbi:MAG: hypothetical protein GX153_04255 [Clostridiaceae bacterium]|jgi:hypothetical protein|nr:hypothetical protein [Clostridiaceae bacterium]